MIFDVLTAIPMKITLFWDVKPCCSTLKMDAGRSSAMSINIHQTAGHHILENSSLNLHFGSFSKGKIIPVHAVVALRVVRG
jgi:hypothetical protein